MKNLQVQYDLNSIKVQEGNLKNYQSIIDNIISPLELSNFMVEADDQDVLSKYIENSWLN